MKFGIFRLLYPLIWDSVQYLDDNQALSSNAHIFDFTSAMQWCDCIDNVNIMQIL